MHMPWHWRLIALAANLTVATALAASASAAGDPQKGVSVFNKCRACHRVGPGAHTVVGPELNGVVGRKAGSLADYPYSSAIKASGLTWDDATLTQWLRSAAGAAAGDPHDLRRDQQGRRHRQRHRLSEDVRPARKHSCRCKAVTADFGTSHQWVIPLSTRTPAVDLFAPGLLSTSGQRPQGCPMLQQEVRRPRVGLFVTCLVDLFRPTIGFAAVKLIEEAGCDVDAPRRRPAAASRPTIPATADDTIAIAKQVIAAFAPFDYVVAPSGSCAGMIKEHYPSLFAGDREWRPRAEALSAKTFELVSFLVDVRGMTEVEATFAGTVTYHDSCSGLRELGVREQPRRLLKSVTGLKLAELKDADVCCGFGGTFCVKYPDISNAIVEKKTAAIAASGAATLLAGDLGCLMNMAGKLQRQGIDVKTRHVAEVLAGMTDTPPIGEAG